MTSYLSTPALSRSSELTYETLLDLLGWKFDRTGEKSSVSMCECSFMNFTCQDLQCVFSPHPRPSYVFDAFRALETASGSTSWKSSALIIDHHLRLLLARGPRELRRFDIGSGAHHDPR